MALSSGMQTVNGRVRSLCTACSRVQVPATRVVAFGMPMSAASQRACQLPAVPALKATSLVLEAPVMQQQTLSHPGPATTSCGLQQQQRLHQKLALQQRDAHPERTQRLPLQRLIPIVRAAPGSSANMMLTCQIKLSTSWQEAYALFVEFSDLFNHINIAALVCHLPKIIRPEAIAPHDAGDFECMLLELRDIAEECLPVCRTRELANLAHGFACLGLKDRRLMQLLLARFNPAHANEQELANTVWALAAMRLEPPIDWLAEVLFTSRARLQAFKPQELANLAWALAAMGRQPGAGWVQEMCGAVGGQLHRYGAADVAMVLWAVAELRHVPDAVWVAAVMRRAAVLVPGMETRQLCCVAWALSVLQSECGISVVGGSEQAMGSGEPLSSSECLATDAQAVPVHASATHDSHRSAGCMEPNGTSKRSTSDSTSSHAGLGPSSTSTANGSNTTTTTTATADSISTKAHASSAALPVSLPCQRAWHDLSHAMCARSLVLVQAEQRPLSHAAKLLLAFAKMGWTPQPCYLEALMSRATPDVEACAAKAAVPADCVSEHADGFSSPHLHAQQHQGGHHQLHQHQQQQHHQHQQHHQQLQHHQHQQQQGVDLVQQRQWQHAQDLSNLLWACVRLSYRPPQPLLDAAALSLRDRASSFGDQELSVSLWALAALRHMPDAGLLAAVQQAAAERAPSLGAQDCTQLIWALARWHHWPGARWLEVVLSQFVKLLEEEDGARLACKPSSSDHSGQDISSGSTGSSGGSGGGSSNSSSHQHSVAHLTAVRHVSRGRHQRGGAGDASKAPTAQLVANVVFSLPRLLRRKDIKGMSQHRTLQSALVVASGRRLGASSCRELVQLAAGFAGMRYNPGVLWLQQHARRCRQLDAQFSERERLQLHKALQHLHQYDAGRRVTAGVAAEGQRAAAGTVQVLPVQAPLPLRMSGITPASRVQRLVVAHTHCITRNKA